MSNKIAACMILGDEYDPKELNETFESLVAGGVDHVFIAYNGKKRFFPGVFDIPFTVEKFAWEEDFAKARTQSFQMVPANEFGWILWIDSDDILETDNGLQNVVKDVDEHTSGVFLRYDYAVEPTTGQVVVEQWRERLLRTSVKWDWIHPIHEVCLGPPGTQFVRKDGAHIRHLRASGEDRGARLRNRRIIAKAKREHPDVPRYVFYFAGETMAEADRETDPEEKANLARAAILAFTDYKEMLDTINDDFFVAQIRIAECFRMAGQFAEAFDADMESIAIYPSWPDGYIGAAKTLMEIGDFGRMLSFADIACKMEKPRTAASIETMNSSFTPLFLRAIANENLGNLDEAVADYRRARNFWNPPNNKLDEKIVELDERLMNGPVVAVPDGDRRRLRGTKPEKSIAFLTTPLPEDWHPELMKINGSGGAELCIMKLAPMFAADGWRVSVFGTPGDHRGVYAEDGVEYWESNEFLTTEKYKVVVSSRTTAPFNTEMEADVKLLWMHDVNSGQALLEMKNQPDKVLALTPWHANHLSKLYRIDPSRISIIPNGIDLDRFPVERSESTDLGSRFIWSSSYDRGLETVLCLWPSIKRRLPDATLDIFYGWNMYDRSIEQWEKYNQNQAEALKLFKIKMETQMAQLGIRPDSGINHHGRVNQDELASFMLASDIWPFTTQFMETFCITAIEMQAAGVIPIASNLAALQNNVAVKDLLIEGWPQNVTYQNQFLDKLDAVYSASSEEILYARQEGRKLAESMTWENAYTKWNDLLRSLGVN